jgi:NAD(P)-dependent dehydrogenase (short-subunit alcohol dehydrogenase family)
MMTALFEGTTALVTGAGRGIGQAVALGLPDAGDTVAVLAGSAEPPDQAAALLPATSGTALTVTADLADTATPGRRRAAGE